MEAAIRRAENGKVMGRDMISNEFFKQGGNSMLTSLTFIQFLCQNIHQENGGNVSHDCYIRQGIGRSLTIVVGLL